MLTLSQHSKTIALDEYAEENKRIDAILELIKQNYHDQNFEFIGKVTPLILKSNRIDAWINLLSNPTFSLDNLTQFSCRFDDENLSKLFRALKSQNETVIMNVMITVSHLDDSGIILNFCLLGLVDYFSFETISKVIDALPNKMIQSIIAPSAETKIDPYFDLFFLKHIVTAFPNDWITCLGRAIKNIVAIRVEYLELDDKTKELTQHFINPAARFHADYLMEPIPTDGNSSRASSLRIESARSINSEARNSIKKILADNSVREQELSDYLEIQNFSMADLPSPHTPSIRTPQVIAASASVTMFNGEQAQPKKIKKPPKKGLMGLFSF